MKYKVINKRTHKEVTAEEVQAIIIAGGSNPRFLLFTNGELRLRTHDAEGYHHFEIDHNYEAMLK